MTFNYTIDCLANLGDSIVERIHGLEKLTDTFAQMGPNYKGSGGSWFNLRDSIIYVFSLLAYIIAYLGFFFADAITHFVWTVLYVVSPLMILMFVNQSTSYVTSSLYKGLAQVIVWKIFYAVLGVLLLKLAVSPQESGLDDYLMSIVVNLCIGVSMLFVPIATRSLVSDGMNSMASGLAMVPALAAGGAIKLAAAKYARKTMGAMGGAGGFMASPLKNIATPRIQKVKDQIAPRFRKMKEGYQKIGMNADQINNFEQQNKYKGKPYGS